MVHTWSLDLPFNLLLLLHQKHLNNLLTTTIYFKETGSSKTDNGSQEGTTNASATGESNSVPADGLKEANATSRLIGTIYVGNKGTAGENYVTINSSRAENTITVEDPLPGDVIPQGSGGNSSPFHDKNSPARLSVPI